MSRRFLRTGSGVLVAASLQAACSCINDDVLSKLSPDGQRTAIIFERNCGAATSISLQVSVLDSGATVPTGVGNVFRAKDTAAVPINFLYTTSIQWLSDNQLQVSYDRRAAVFLQKSKIGSVHVVYNLRGSSDP